MFQTFVLVHFRSPVAVPEEIVTEPAAGSVVPVNEYECFAPSSVSFQPARLTEDEPLFVIFTVSPCRSRAVIETEPDPDDAGTVFCC